MTCTGGRTLFSIVLGLSLFCSGCISRSARFTPSDQTFQPQQAANPPQVFIDRPPKMTFASVGILEVRGPVTASEEDFLHTAVAKGMELGCDLLVHQAAYEMRPGVGPRRHLNGAASWLFTCGVLDPTKPAAETARLADTVALEIVRSEFGEPFCPLQAGTGTHLVAVKCMLPGTYAIWNNGQLWLPTPVVPGPR